MTLASLTNRNTSSGFACRISLATRYALTSGSGSRRPARNVLAGDFLVALGASAGTLSEICLAWIHGKTVLTLRGVGGWAERLASAPLDERRGSRIVVCDDLDRLRQEIEAILSGT